MLLTRKMDLRLNRELDVIISLSFSLSLMPRCLPTSLTAASLFNLFLVSFISPHFHSHHCCSADQTSQPQSPVTASRVAVAVHIYRSYLRPANVFSTWTSKRWVRMATRAHDRLCWSRPQASPCPVRIGTTTDSARRVDTPVSRMDRCRHTVARWYACYGWDCLSLGAAHSRIYATVVAHRIEW